MKMKEDIEVKINTVLDKVKPFLEQDGGGIKYVKFEDGIVYVKMLGACSGCPMLGITLKNTVEQFVINEIPEVKEVREV